MPLYSYKAKNKKGQVTEDVIQSTSRSDAASSIKADGLQVLTIKSLDKGFGLVSFGGISIAEKASFCRFMGTMLKAGLPLPEAVDIIKDETKNAKMKKCRLCSKTKRHISTSKSSINARRDWCSPELK